MTESKICTCPSGDGSLRWPCPEHPAVEQAGGDERAAFELFVRKHCGMPEHIAVNWDAKFTNDAWEGWQARAALAQPSQSQYEASFEEWLANELEGEDGQPVPAAVCDIALARRAFNHWHKLEQPAKVGGVRFSAGVSSRLVVEAAQRLYEFESTPEKEAERPEVVAVRYEDGTILSAEECGIALEVCAKVQTPLMTVSQHERIVGALRAEITQLRQHKNDYMDAGQETYRALQNEIREREAEIARLDGLVSSRTTERDAALAEVERLRESKGDPVGSLEKCMKVMYERDEHAKRLEAAQAQHGVPDGASDLCRFLAKLYCELDGLRYSTAKLPAEQIADALIFKWPVLQGARNQLNIKRISEQPYDESKLHSAIAAMLAAAPAQGGE
ncbi:TPA: hypothetical protein L4G84_004009 [Pseudomonas aeruginosa]|nr:hypothetical protein [Pseudomonas aeruginosa]